MIIKKYQGKTEIAATEAARKELGQNVVVMNVRNVKKKGILGLFAPQQVEVTVALEEESEKAALTKKEVPLRTAEKTEPMVRPAFQNRQVSEVEETLQKAEKTEKAIEDKLDSLQSFLEQKLQKQDEDAAKKNSDRKEEPEEENENLRFLKLLYNTMLENEINETFANQIIDELDRTTKPNMPIDFMLSSVYQKIILKFGHPSGITKATEGPKVVFFVGPTGVGKTTTIAKIASQFCVEQKKRIVLLTADTYRIAAAEQLRTYANILEVPFRVIYSSEELQEAVKDFSEYDYVFVDTAGHSHHNEGQRDTTRMLLRALTPEVESEIYLVVSATTKYRDLVSIADSYTQITNYKLIFTKLDETTTLGNILNLKLHTGAELSYVTCGQNVPDDIADFSPQGTVKELLAGNR